MNIPRDPALLSLFGGVLAMLTLASGTTRILECRIGGESARATVANLTARVRSWWVMCGVFCLTLLAGRGATLILFALLSLLALREFLALSAVGRSDHRALLWAFYILVPVQYIVIGSGREELFSIVLPVGALLIISIRNALTGETGRFLERTSEIYWGVMICVYCPSFAPALLTLRIPGYDGPNAKLLLYFVIIVELSDVLQYVWGKLAGKRAIAPKMSPHKTWEGFWGGILCASLAGAMLWWVTPFGFWTSGGMALLITLLGFASGLVLSAVKRDRGVKDFGALIRGHGGVLDRIDSLCFAAPVFFYVTRYI
jgi:phosphatidate cytidylyltransferase